MKIRNLGAFHVELFDYSFGRIIISERFLPRKTIPPVTLGGMVLIFSPLFFSTFHYYDVLNTIFSPCIVRRVGRNISYKIFFSNLLLTRTDYMQVLFV
jgi:hypothetical protein